MSWKAMLTILVLCSIGFAMMLSTAMLGIAARDPVKAVIGSVGVVVNGFFAVIYWIILARGHWKK